MDWILALMNEGFLKECVIAFYSVLVYKHGVQATETTWQSAYYNFHAVGNELNSQASAQKPVLCKL